MELCLEKNANPWMLTGYSETDNGLVMRKMTEDYEGYHEVIMAETDLGLVCIDKKNKIVDFFETLRDAYTWLHDYDTQ